MRPHQLSVLAARVRQAGILSIPALDRRTLRDVFAQELRKGAVNVAAMDDARALACLCEHVERAFAIAHTTALVAEMRPRLAFHARHSAALDSRAKRVPVTALLLYATWIEHWLNLVLTLARLRRGESARDIESYLESGRPTFKARADYLRDALGLRYEGSTPVPARAIRLMALRGRVFHHPWRGLSKGRFASHLGEIGSVVRDAPALLADLSEREHAWFDRPHEALLDRLFPPRERRPLREAL